MLSLEKANDIINFANRELHSDLSEDPIGLVTLLFFLLKNMLESSAVDTMVAQTNAWVDEKLNKHKFSRFFDREFVAAVFGFYALQKFKRLRTTVERGTLDQMLSSHIEDNHFFHNYTYSVMIALSISDQEISVYRELLGWIVKQFTDETVFNDAKKLVFTAMFFHLTNREQELSRLLENCYHRLLEGSIPYHDRIYYAWVVWQFRNLFSKEKLPKSRQLVTSSLENFIRQLKEEEAGKAAEEIYGNNAAKFKPSRIALGVYLDLSRNFASNTMVVSREELAKTPLLTRFGTLLSMVLLGIDSSILYFSIALGVLPKIPTELVVENLTIILLTAITDIGVMFFIVLIAVVSLSLLWDTGIKGYANSRLIVSNLERRIREWMKEILIGDIILGILIWILIGI